MPVVGGAALSTPCSILFCRSNVSMQSPSSLGVDSSLAFLVRLSSSVRFPSAPLVKVCCQYVPGSWRVQMKSPVSATPSSFPLSIVQFTDEGSPVEVGTSFCFLALPNGAGHCLDATGRSFARFLEQHRVLMRHLGLVGFGCVNVWTGGAAFSEDVVARDGGDGLQNLLPVLFVAAFVGLAILTSGVIYLSISDFLEKRQRNESQKIAGEEKLDETGNGGPAKGFGSKKVGKKVEKKRS